MSRLGLLLLVATTSCLTSPREGVHSATPADAVVAGAMTAEQLAKPEPTSTLYGWHLDVVGDRVKYFACSDVDVCSFKPVEIESSSLVGTQIVHRTAPVREDGTKGDETDVVRLTVSHGKTTTRGGVSSDARGLVVR